MSINTTDIDDPGRFDDLATSASPEAGRSERIEVVIPSAVTCEDLPFGRKVGICSQMVTDD